MAFISFEIDIEAGKLRSYLNGNLKSEIKSLGITSKLQIPLRIGTMNSSGYPGNGVIDEVRITKVARYKGLNFLPPVNPFPNQ